MNPYKSGKFVVENNKIVAFYVVDYDDNSLSFFNHNVEINGNHVKNYEYEDLIPSIMKELRKLVPNGIINGSFKF